MCGLVGFCGSGNHNPDKIKTLLAMNYPRGKDSTGIYNHVPGAPLAAKFQKTLGPVLTDMLPLLGDMVGTKLFIGHTRATTVGLINLSNAHPFVFKNVVGAHNGTLQNHRWLTKKYAETLDSEAFTEDNISVDSKIFPAYFGHAGIEETDVLKTFRGAAALLWADHESDSNTLYVYRNGGRPLHFVRLPEGIYISSEDDPLSAIAPEEAQIYMFKPFVRYKITDGQIVERSEPIHQNAPTGPGNFTKTKDYAKTAKSTQKSLASMMTKFLNDAIEEITYLEAPSVASVKNLHEKGKIMVTYENKLVDHVVPQNTGTRRLRKVQVAYSKQAGMHFVLHMYDDNSFTQRPISKLRTLEEKFLDHFEKKQKAVAN